MNPTLIIGQGIAGSVLALRLHEKGIPFLVIDDGHKTSSSTAAAGLYNALVYKRGNLTWRAQEHFSACEGFYSAWEARLQKAFLHKSSLYRRIHDAQEFNDWTARRADPQRAPFILGTAPSTEFPEAFDLPHGTCKVKGGWVDVNSFLRAVRAFLIDIDGYRQGKVELHELQSSHGQWTLQGKEFAKVVLCTGYRSAFDDRFFPELPFSLAKGHVLTLSIPGAGLDKVINANVFVIPMGEDIYKVGSTFSWENLNEEIELGEVEKIEREFKRLCSLPYEIIDKSAGVRPTVQDQRPLIGESSRYPGIWHFGGFGSRAILTCPELAAQFIEVLSGKQIQDEETSVLRHRL